MNNVAKISCYIRTLNEAQNIAETVRAAKKVSNEVVVVDSGSTDSTVHLATAEGARVIEQSWLGNGHQKRVGEEVCCHNWVLDIDADEVVTDDLAQEIRALFSGDGDGPDADIYEIPLITVDPGGHVWTKCPVVRRAKLYDKRKIRAPAHGVWDQFRIPDDPTVGRLQGALLHYSFSGMGQLALKMAKANIQKSPFLKPRRFLSSALKVYFGLPVYFFIRYVVRGFWREGSYGFMAAVAVSYSHWCRHAISHESHLLKKRRKLQNVEALPSTQSVKRRD